MKDILLPMAIIGLLGGILGFVLAFASKVFYVQEDERLAKVTELLPGYNCGACGFAGCAGMAEALVTKVTDDTKRCKPSNPNQRQSIKDYLASTPGPDGELVEVKA